MQTVIRILCRFPDELEYHFSGCGFIINQYLVTAGHVVNSDVRFFFAEINNEIIPLKNPKYLSINKNRPNLYDLAIYEIIDKNSPLALSEDAPKVGMKLNGKCFSGKKRDSIISYDLEINTIQGKYFEGETSVQTYQGSSGSPIYYNDVVFGMLVAGNCDKDGNRKDPNQDIKHCRYLSSHCIMKKLKRIQEKDNLMR